GEPAERHPARGLHLWRYLLSCLRDSNRRCDLDPLDRSAQQRGRIRRGLSVRIEQRAWWRGAVLQPPRRTCHGVRPPVERYHVVDGIRPADGARRPGRLSAEAARLLLVAIR